jgi:hypothetical protein
MLAVRGVRILALSVVGALALLGGVVAGPVAPASATAGVIDGHVYELDGTTPISGLRVLFDDGSDPPAYQYTTTDVNGYYSFTPTAGWDDEAFAIVVFGGSSHLDDGDTGYYESIDPASGEVDDFLLGPARRITGIVRDAGTGSPLENVVVIAKGQTSGDSYAALPPTDSTGVFDLGVPPGDDYAIFAADGDGDYDPQGYDHIDFSFAGGSGCGCSIGDLVTVPAGTGAPITGIDFDLHAYEEWIDFSVLALMADGSTPYPGVRVYLDKWNAGTSTWDPVESRLTDVDGFTDLLGYEDGDFRLRYKIGAAFVAVLSYDDYIGPPFPVWEGGYAVHLENMDAGGCGCEFTEQDVDLVFANPSSGGGSGGGGPGGSPRTGGGSSAIADTTPTATPTPTPTSTPSPSSSPTAEPSASPTPTPQPVPTGDEGFPWWIILIIVLAIGIVVTIILVLRRR